MTAVREQLNNPLSLFEIILDRLRRVSSLIDPEHAIDHAVQVQKNGRKYAEALGLSNPGDLEILDAACLLHDVGRALRQKTDHLDAREHVVRGVNLACQILAEIPPFCQNPQKLNLVLGLIYHHDDEFYQFAFYPKERKLSDPEIGKPAIIGGKLQEVESVEFNESVMSDPVFEKMLLALKLADKEEASGEKGARRTLRYAFLQLGQPFQFWPYLGSQLMWQEHATLGNVDLAIRGKLLVARHHPQLLDQAWQEYEEGFRFIQQFMGRRQSEGIFPPSIEILPLVKEDFYRAVLREKDLGGLALLDIGTNDFLRSKLWEVSLLGNPAQTPYMSNQFSDEEIDFAVLSPDLTKEVFLCFYHVSSAKLQTLIDLRDLFLAKYAFDILTLNGVIKYQKNGKTYTLAPPIVEYSNVHNNFVLMDGLTRFVLAQMLDRPIGVIIARQIREDYFPVPFEPLGWESISVGDYTSEEVRRCIPRFPTNQALLDFFAGRRLKHNDHKTISKHPSYFFVRDFSSLGIESTRIPQELAV